jgi:hypothetical protein
MIKHADLFDQLPRRMIGGHDAQHAEPDVFGAQRNVRNQQIRRRRIAGAEMMLAEENALETGWFGTGPQIEIGVEIALRRGRIEPIRHFRRRCENSKIHGV